jgi:hypothetical protein
MVLSGLRVWRSFYINRPTQKAALTTSVCAEILVAEPFIRLIFQTEDVEIPVSLIQETNKSQEEDQKEIMPYIELDAQFQNIELAVLPKDVKLNRKCVI